MLYLVHDSFLFDVYNYNIEYVELYMLYDIHYIQWIVCIHIYIYLYMYTGIVYVFYYTCDIDIDIDTNFNMRIRSYYTKM